jgi:glycolate oxidase FAD binding subunit
MTASIDTSALARDLDALIGIERVRLPRPHELRAARLIVEPASADEIAELVRKCETDKITLAALGAARTLSQIRPAPIDLGVSLAKLDRIVAYEPDDMTIVAETGLTLGALNREVGKRGQRLAADPIHPDQTTLGSLIAASKSGPLRLNDGTVRDLLIGIRFVGHDGRMIHGGGRVVKNVAGYDLMKVMTGSFGTLGIVTEATFKVRPIADNYTLICAAYDHAGDAFAAARLAEAAAPLLHLEVASPTLCANIGMRDRFVLFVGFGGSSTEAATQHNRLIEALGANLNVLTGADALAAYEQLRDLDYPNAALSAQIAVLPAELGRCLIEAGVEFRAHAACGVAQLYLGAQTDSAEVRSAVLRWREMAHTARGHLRVLAVRSDAHPGVEFFDQPPPAVFTLMRNLKSAFDPRGIFNPGCFVGGL